MGFCLLGFGWLVGFLQTRFFLLILKAIMTVNSYTQRNGIGRAFMNVSDCSILLSEGASRRLTHLSHKDNLQENSTLSKE